MHLYLRGCLPFIFAILSVGCSRIDVVDHTVAPKRHATQYVISNYHDENPFCSDYKGGLGPNHKPRVGQVIVGGDNSYRKWGLFDSCWETIDHHYYGFVAFDVSAFKDNIVRAELIFQREKPSDDNAFQIYQPSNDWREGFLPSPGPWHVQFPVSKAEDRAKFYVDEVPAGKKTITINVTDIVRNWVRKAPDAPANRGFVILPMTFNVPHENSHALGFFGNFRLIITTPKS